MKTHKEIAEMLNGREYRNEITDEIKQLAKDNGIVIVYGSSDDLMEFDGAIYDEADCFDGGTIYLNEAGVFDVDCDCEHPMKAKNDCKTIEAVWCDKDNGYIWSYKTEIPHSTFEILEDGEKYCLGICFNISDL